MFPSPYRDDERAVYWIVGTGQPWRHATTALPGALPAGEWVPTLCSQWIRLPYCTVSGRTPKTAVITSRCPVCVEVADGRECTGVPWDF